MTLSLRPALLILTILSLGQCLACSFGFYAVSSLVFVLLAWLAALAGCLGPERTWNAPPALGGRIISVAAALLVVGAAIAVGLKVIRPDLAAAVMTVGSLAVLLAPRLQVTPTAALLGAAALVLSGENALNPLLFHARRDTAPQRLLIEGVAWTGFAGWLLTLSLLPSLDARRRGTGLRGRVMLLLACAGLQRGLVVAASPSPVIDVYTALHGGANTLAHGDNPYRAEYVSPYTHEPADPDDGYPFYPPLPFVLIAPVSAAGLDVRWVNVAGDLLAAGALLAAGRSGVGALAAAAYLFHPTAPLVTEQAWYEPILAALAGWGLVLAGRGRRLGDLLLGLALTGKQYGLVALAPILKTATRRPRLLLGVGAAALVVLLPFLLWEPAAFLRAVVVYHLRLPSRHHALTLTSAVVHIADVQVPRGWFLGMAAVLIAAITWWAPRHAAGYTTGAVLLTFFLCHAQAYCNYYLLCQYYFLFGVAACEPRLLLARRASGGPSLAGASG